MVYTKYVSVIRVKLKLVQSQQTEDVESMLVYRWSNVKPSLIHRGVSVWVCCMTVVVRAVSDSMFTFIKGL